jgi:hypothetical protein
VISGNLVSLERSFQDAKAGYHWAKQPPMLVGQEVTPVK